MINDLSIAKSGDRSYHMIDQAKILYERMKMNDICHWENDWKMVTFFVGVRSIERGKINGES